MLKIENPGITNVVMILFYKFDLTKLSVFHRKKKKKVEKLSCNIILKKKT